MFKKETRILGVSARQTEARRIPVVGVVFRGSLWLDGVITCLIDRRSKDQSSVLAEAIRRSKQYSQVRAVILSREPLFPDASIDIIELARLIKRPVVSMIRRTSGFSTKARRKPFSEVRVAGKPVLVRIAGIDAQVLEELFAVGCVDGSRIPEAARVADLITGQVGRFLQNTLESTGLNSSLS